MSLVLTLAWRNLWRHAGRTLLTATSVALGLGFLLVMLGLGDGTHLQMIEATVRTGSGHVLLQAPGYQQRRGVDMVVPAEEARRVEAWARARPEVLAVLPRAFASGLLSSADGAAGVNVTGIDPAAEAAVSRFPSRLAAGRFLAAGDGNVAVVGSGIARSLKIHPGSRVVAMAQGASGSEVRSVLLRVVGVLHTGLDEVDEALVLVPLHATQQFLAMDDAVHQVALILDDQARSRALARAARRAFPGLEALTWAEARPELEAFITIDDGSAYLFDGIFFVLIAFVVLDTLLVSLLERRREFSLLGALGLGPARRLAMVLTEALLLAGLSVAAGAALGLAGHFYFKTYGLPMAWFTEQNIEAGGAMVEPIMYSALSWRRLVGSIVLVVGMTLVLSLTVARRAARPVEVGLLK